jgi:hypothetical protein
VSLYDTHEAETLGRNRYIALTVGLTTRDTTDTHEADTLGPNRYAFLTAGNNSYVPGNIPFLIPNSRRLTLMVLQVFTKKRKLDTHFVRLQFFFFWFGIVQELSESRSYLSEPGYLILIDLEMCLRLGQDRFLPHPVHFVTSTDCII